MSLGLGKNTLQLIRFIVYLETKLSLICCIIGYFESLFELVRHNALIYKLWKQLITSLKSYQFFPIENYSDIPVNCVDDELVRKVTVLNTENPRHEVSMSFASPIVSTKARLFPTGPTAADRAKPRAKRQYKSVLLFQINRTKSLLLLNRTSKSIATGIKTRHCLKGTHGKRMSCFSNDLSHTVVGI